MISTALRAAPVATLVLLAVWAFLDVLMVADPRWAPALLTVLAFALGGMALAAVFRLGWIRPLALAALATAYFAAHAFVLGVQVVPALLYLTALIAHVELRILAERFAPLFASVLGPSERRRIGGALARALLRLSIASALAVLVPILAADLAVTGIVPATTIPTAILLSAGLVAVVVVIALLPILERRAA